MEIREKALYNLLRINWLENPTISVKPWQVENYRELPMDTLFLRLKQLGIPIWHDTFPIYAESCDSPEELAECLWVKDDITEDYDQIYLLVFELWRRLLPEKKSLSIFCDEIDYQMFLYDNRLNRNEEGIQKALADLEDTLDESADEEGSPREVFARLESYCAFDLENFIYDYIAEQIDLGNDTYASELLDGFYSYIIDAKWFDFLRVRLYALTDKEKAMEMLLRLLESIEEEPDLDLLMEIAAFLESTTEMILFFRAARLIAENVKGEEDFQDILNLVVTYFKRLGLEEKPLERLRARSGPLDHDRIIFLDLIKEFSEE